MLLAFAWRSQHRESVEKNFEELDYQNSVLGELILRRRKIPMLENAIVHEVILNGEFLMSSLFHAAEDALADLGIAACTERSLDIVIGGLGLGYTAVAALAYPKVRSITVVEMLEPVIRWHHAGLLPVGTQVADDDRVHFVQGDFFTLATGDRGFDPVTSDQQYHAILLDIDHTPTHWLHPRNAGFYSKDGLRKLTKYLLPSGIFAMWSDGAADAAFLNLLREIFAHTDAHTITFPNPIQMRESSSTIYVARRA